MVRVLSKSTIGQYVQCGEGKSDGRQCTYDVPQGSVLGSLLFIIYIDNMPNSLNSSSHVLFVDDGTLFVTSSDIYDALQSMNEDTKLLCDWFKVKVKLALNISKTDYIIFTKANHLQHVGLILKIGNTILESFLECF